MAQTTVVLRISRSQQMAILDVLMEHMRCPNHTEEFIDVSTDTTTNYGDLLTVFGDTSEMKLAG